MKFSIIIPVRSINDFLRENIRNIKALDYEDFEVFIILDAYENYDFNGDLRFKLIATGPIGPGEKRNVAAEQATGDILVFLDDDAYPRHDWLNKANAIFSHEDIYALGAPGVTPLDAPFLEKCSGYVLESPLSSLSEACRYTSLQRRLVKDYPTVNLFVKKSAFDSVDGFIKEFWPGEDTKLCLDLVKKFGKPFLYDPAPIVYHHRRYLFKPHLKQISRYGRHRGYFAKIFPETSRTLNIPYFIPALFVLGVFFGPILSYLFWSLWYFYFGALAMYFSLILMETARFSLRDKNLKTGVYVGFGILLSHVVYGVNFILGLLKRPSLKLKRINLETGNYSEG